jgi:hypothetical protein
MTLLDRMVARGLEFPADPIITARIERHVRRIQPDPMFRRRLRSVVVNRYVATREGLVSTPARPAMCRQMGALGRGVLYASLLAAVSVTAAGAASASSLPGDALYGVKLELEQIRMRVAPPNLRDDLAAMALDERLDEVERLAAAGRWDLVDDAAELAARAEATLAALAPDGAGGGLHRAGGLVGDSSPTRHAQRLAELMAIAPASARDGLQVALDASTAEPVPNGNANGAQNGHGQADGAQQPGSNGVPHDPRGGGTPASRANSGHDANGSNGSGDASQGGGRASHGGSNQPSPAASPVAQPSTSPGHGNKR